MIGGTDIVIPAVGDAETLEGCARIVQRCWPHARFEDAETGDRYPWYGAVPFDAVHELFVYADAPTEAAWDAGSADVRSNSMLYLIINAERLTAVLDDPNTVEMRTMLNAMRTLMRTRNSSPGLKKSIEAAA